MIRVLVVLLLGIGQALAYKNVHYVEGHSTMVHLFEWKWDDIADECERFLGPHKFGGIQVSPPNENVIIWQQTNRPWYERYQVMSYKLVTRSGDEQQFANMVRRCNNAGVRIYVDAIINHMTGEPEGNVGTAGSTAIFNQWLYPAVPYTAEHFNWPPCGIEDWHYSCCPERVRNCELVGLKDLDQSLEHVRQMIVNFMNTLIDLGVAGFRIDAALWMWPEDLQIIYNRLNNLNTSHHFAPGSRPYIYQEVTDFGYNAISRWEYTPLAAVTEFRYGLELSRAFRGANELRWLENWGPAWDLMPHEEALTFIDNHDNQRENPEILTYKTPKQYRAAVAFMLAHPYGEPQLMSSFDFSFFDQGPPADNDGNIISPVINSDGSCGNGWICEHRWRAMYQMVGFRNAVAGTGVNGWWDNFSNQIAFCRGNRGFVAFNNDNWDFLQYQQTCLPAGTYCDVISGVRSGNGCTGKSVVVDNEGRAQIYIATHEFDSALAIHVGVESRL